MTMMILTPKMMTMCSQCPGAKVRLGCGECGWQSVANPRHHHPDPDDGEDDDDDDDGDEEHIANS